MNVDISAWNHVIVYYMFIVVANDFSLLLIWLFYQ